MARGLLGYVLPRFWAFMHAISGGRLCYPHQMCKRHGHPEFISFHDFEFKWCPRCGHREPKGQARYG